MMFLSFITNSHAYMHQLSYTQEACLKMKVYNNFFLLYVILLCLCTAQTGKTTVYMHYLNILPKLHQHQACSPMWPTVTTDFLNSFFLANSFSSI